MKVKILKTELVARNVKRLFLEKPDGFSFTPGQAIEISIDKPGFVNKKRPFTFTGLNTDEYLEFTIKAYPVSEFPDHQGVTEEIHKLEEGDKLNLGVPFGAIRYKGDGVFIAGGAGVTPFIAIFRQLSKENKLGSNKLIFSNKKSEDIIYESYLKQIFSPEHIKFILTQEKSQGYESGRIDEIFLKKQIEDFSGRFYLCGPWKMVESIQVILQKLGAKPESLVFEK